MVTLLTKEGEQHSISWCKLWIKRGSPLPLPTIPINQRFQPIPAIGHARQRRRCSGALTMLRLKVQGPYVDRSMVGVLHLLRRAPRAQQRTSQSASFEHPSTRLHREGWERARTFYLKKVVETLIYWKMQYLSSTLRVFGWLTLIQLNSNISEWTENYFNMEVTISCFCWLCSIQK